MILRSMKRNLPGKKSLNFFAREFFSKALTTVFFFWDFVSTYVLICPKGLFFREQFFQRILFSCQGTSFKSIFFKWLLRIFSRKNFSFLLEVLFPRKLFVCELLQRVIFWRHFSDNQNQRIRHQWTSTLNFIFFYFILLLSLSEKLFIVIGNNRL